MSRIKQRVLWPTLIVGTTVLAGIAYNSARTVRSTYSAPAGPTVANPHHNSLGNRISIAPGLEQNSNATIKVTRITILPTGFDPGEITRAAGQFLLAVDNQSGLDEILLRIQREGGQRQHEKRVGRGSLKWRTMASLQPGRYVLTEALHPEWRCVINITR